MERNVAIIGSGAREHSIGLKLLASKHVKNLYVIPGSLGLHLSCPEKVIQVGK